MAPRRAIQSGITPAHPRGTCPPTTLRHTLGAIILLATSGSVRPAGDINLRLEALQGSGQWWRFDLARPRHQPKFAQPEHHRGKKQRKKKVEDAKSKHNGQ